MGNSDKKNKPHENDNVKLEKNNNGKERSGLNSEFKDIEQYESKTKYGETIPSMFSWITPSEQKKRADELNRMTRNK